MRPVPNTETKSRRVSQEQARARLAAGITARATSAHPELERSVHGLVAGALRAGLDGAEVVSIAWAAWREAGAAGMLHQECGHRISSIRLVGERGSCCPLCVEAMENPANWSDHAIQRHAEALAYRAPELLTDLDRQVFAEHTRRFVSTKANR